MTALGEVRSRLNYWIGGSGFGWRVASGTARPLQQLRIVGNNSVHAEILKPQHRIRIIYRPYDDLLPRSLYFANKLRFDQFLLRNHVLNRNFAPQPKLILELADQAQWDGGILRTQGLQHSGSKGGHDESSSRLAAQKQIERNSLQPLDLQLDVEKRIAVALKNVPQPRQLRNLFRSGAGNLNSADLRIMADYRFLVLSKAHIELKSIAAVCQRAVEGFHSIFQNASSGARTAMAEQ